MFVLLQGCHQFLRLYLRREPVAQRLESGDFLFHLGQYLFNRGGRGGRAGTV